jgi:hypothetical protein
MKIKPGIVVKCRGILRTILSSAVTPMLSLCAPANSGNEIAVHLIPLLRLQLMAFVSNFSLVIFDRWGEKFSKALTSLKVGTANTWTKNWILQCSFIR